MVIFGMFRTVGTFGTPIAFGTMRIGPVFSTIIPSEFWCTLVHLTVGTLHQLVQ